MTRCIFYTILVFICNNIIAQKKDNKNSIHHIVIFKIFNDGEEKSNFIKIDDKGNFEHRKVAKIKKGVVVHYTSFFRGLDSLIKANMLEYVAPSDNPPRAASIPKLNKQSIYFTIVTNTEMEKSKGFNTGSYFSWSKSNFDKNSQDYEILETIHSKTRKQLLALLHN